MNRKYWTIGAVSVSIVAVIVLVTVVTRDKSPEKWISGKYKRVSSDTYRSPKKPADVAREIRKELKPIDRVNDMATLGNRGGVFLRYPKHVVAVLPYGVGSRITVDSASRGYSRYHTHVGGHWSTPGSNGWNSRGSASFRGGGPGSGK
ncbi:DUF4247 domain-containing protein [Actinomadura algeriensis]|uniref:DUF4247 domain-containing protein n=1 Tax=Actinomadura algeriensis TaxID=1679523 RepID=A0ABR9JUK6_9ACTN|nr:DUF4247 domain-containing protein [Actinomadura algeriensis]MBE1534257.1 hypothetical protein [Actinomadura algeriensis]